MGSMGEVWLQDPMVYVDLSRGIPGGEQCWLDGWADTGLAQTASAPEESSAI